MVILTIILLLLVPVVSAKEGTTRLLALISKADKDYGTAASLDLDLQPGNNHVFLETFPPTKVSTQVSMRFAQQITCSTLDIDCSGYDFFYTIRSLPGVVGGPSAGAAASVLTASLLLDKPLRKDAAITGTINSGGLIGSVGGIKGKIKAASENGINLVLIPQGTRMYGEDELEIKDTSKKKTGLNDTNITSNKIDLVEYGRNLSINVTEVATLAEAIELFTGYKVKESSEEFVIDPGYLATMKDVAVDLCARNANITNSFDGLRMDLDRNASKKEVEAKNYSDMGKNSFNSSEFYSSASYCFRSSVTLKQLLFNLSNLTKEEIAAKAEILALEINYFEKEINGTAINTITDLQTMMAVRERVFEAREAVSKILEEKKENAALLAYAEERLYSAKVWSKFFDGEKTEFELDEKHLKQSCQSKINEAEERYSYANTILPALTTNVRSELDKAHAMLDKKQYVSCLYQAIKTKSEVDVILGLIGVEEERLDELIELKLSSAKRELVKAQQKGIFPIISYSYYEYANSLKEIDDFSSLLFVEYALEFANLDIYFPKKKSIFNLFKRIDRKVLFVFFLGLFAGILLMWRPRNDYKTLQTPPKKRLRGKKR